MVALCSQQGMGSDETVRILQGTWISAAWSTLLDKLAAESGRTARIETSESSEISGEQFAALLVE